MLTKKIVKRDAVYRKIRLMANQYRFRILELTQDVAINITQLSNILGLSYTKCADYVTLLEKEGLVEKTKQNKETIVRSKVAFTESGINFDLAT